MSLKERTLRKLKQYNLHKTNLVNYKSFFPQHCPLIIVRYDAQLDFQYLNSDLRVEKNECIYGGIH